MDKKYILPVSVLVLLGVLLAFSSIKTNIKEEISPDVLHKNIVEQTRYISVEKVAKMLVEKDPSIILIDVRPVKEFEKFSLPDAISIPLDSILLPAYQDYLGQDVYNAILYSNGTLAADQAWILCKRQGYTNNLVMRGGLNAWVENVLRPTYSDEFYDKEDEALYEFRKGLSMYFGGGSAIDQNSKSGKSKHKKGVKKRRKKGVEGGCG
jgi:rhodanese-related sulfurtransferase